MSNVPTVIYVTFVEKEGSYLKIWGQTDRSLSMGIEKVIQQMTIQFESGRFLPTIDSLQLGILCCAKFKDGSYYRARITNINYLSQGLIEVLFLDYGNKDFIPWVNTRLVSGYSSSIISVPPQAKEYILANITHHGTKWDDTTFEMISSELRYLEFNLTLISNIGPYTLIRITRNNDDVAMNLVARGMVLSVPTPAQCMVLQNYLGIVPTQPQLSSPPDSTLPLPQINSPTILTYKAIPLEPGSEHTVYVSYVTDGPCLFSIQLRKLEETLKILMTEINHITLQLLEENPLPGTVCLARSLEDDYICRAVITNMVDSKFKVFYVDFGNTEVLPFDRVYQIPFKYVIPKVMAMRFALAGLEHHAVSIEMKCVFKNFVNNKLLHLRVKPAATKSALTLCDLWDENQTTVLDIVKKAALVSYPDAAQLTRGSSQEVKVSYVYSCNKFYVQLKLKENELNQAMSELQLKCSNKNVFPESEIKEGMPCCALYESDQQWYRAQVLHSRGDNVTVRYIDFGNEEVVPVSRLIVPDSQQVIMLRPQAIECCLSGYQNMEPDKQRDKFLEELILEKNFNMKVVEVQAGRVLVDLFDSYFYNVASLLLDKLANVNSQADPLLIQNNQVFHQHKHSSHPIQSSKERKSLREHNDKWDKATIDNWRQKSPRKENSFDKSPSARSFRSDHSRNSSVEEKKISQRNRTYERNDYQNEKKFTEKPNRFRSRADGEGRSFGTNDYRRDSRDKSWSDGSEKGKRRSPKPYSNQKQARYEKNGNLDERNFETVETFDLAPSNAAFPFVELTGLVKDVTVTWFHNPLHFYCQIQEKQKEFRDMMEDIQVAYRKRKPETCPVGAPVVALFPDDNVLYRAVVVENNPVSFRVHYVDFGNISVTEKIWPIEKKFMELPVQAICCGLSGICCPGEKWPEPSCFEWFFNKNTFTCSFVFKDINKYGVDLTTDVNISRALIEAGLALAPKTDDSYHETIDFNLLCGQQMRVFLRNISDGESFRVALNPYVIFDCFLENHASTEKLLDYLNKFLIIFVDNVVNDRLEVSVYNLNGQKLLPIVEADDCVDSLCALPVLNSILSGRVCYAGEDFVCIQPSKCFDVISDLLEGLYEYCSKLSTSETISPAVGQVYAVLSSDGNWYRGRAVTINRDGNVDVIYIDYGNGETVSVSRLRILAEDFLTRHMLAIQVFLNENGNGYLGQVVTVELKNNNCIWTGQILRKDTTETSTNFTQKLDETGEVAPEPEVIGVRVVLSHVDSPSDFYLQLNDDVGAIDEMQRGLREEVSNWVSLENPTPGVLCAALYSADQAWYRAQVLDGDSDITTVRFVDYGNTDVLSNNDISIKTLPMDLLTIDWHARRCSLNVKPNDLEWTAGAFKRFEELTESLLSAEIIHQDEKISYVNLYAGENNVGKILVEEGFASIAELKTKVSCTGFVSHLNSPSEFYIQLESDVPQLEWTAERLASASTYPELQDLAPGSLCAAIFSEDEMWYRARILSNTVAGIEVLFIDYGNSCTCSSLRELPEDLIMLPPLAQKCSLQRPAGILRWSAQSAEKFKAIAEDGAAIFTVNKIKPREKTVVQLLLNDEDVSVRLLPITEEGYLSHVESLEKFYVQKSENVEKLEGLATKMSEAGSWPEKPSPEIGDLVAALFVEDNAWYRAKIVTKTDAGYELEFIDYGNSMIVGSVRELPLELAEENPYAICCRLDTVPGIQLNENSLKIFVNLSMGGATIFNVEFVTENIVTLYLDGIDVRLKLEGILSSPANSNQSSPRKNYESIKKTDLTISSISENELAVLVQQEDSFAEASLNGTKESYEQEITNITNEIMERCFVNEESDSDCRNDDSKSPHNIEVDASNSVITTKTEDSSSDKNTNLDINVSLNVNISSNFNEELLMSSEMLEQTGGIDSEFIDSEASTHSSPNNSSDNRDFDPKIDFVDENSRMLKEPVQDSQIPTTNAASEAGSPKKTCEKKISNKEIEVSEAVSPNETPENIDSDLKTNEFQADVDNSLREPSMKETFRDNLLSKTCDDTNTDLKPEATIEVPETFQAISPTIARENHNSGLQTANFQVGSPMKLPNQKTEELLSENNTSELNISLQVNVSSNSNQDSMKVNKSSDLESTKEADN